MRQDKAARLEQASTALAEILAARSLTMDLFRRSGNGRLERRDALRILRRGVWLVMEAEGFGPSVIGKVCGCNPQVVRESISKEIVLVRPSRGTTKKADISEAPLTQESHGDAWAWPEVTSPTIRARDAALAALRIGPYIFDRPKRGALSKKPVAVRARAAVWNAMREQGFSFPEIGAACGCTHTTVISALQKGTK